jgi:hypothetical protein
MRHTGHASHCTLHAQVIVPLSNQIESIQTPRGGPIGFRIAVRECVATGHGDVRPVKTTAGEAGRKDQAVDAKAVMLTFLSLTGSVPQLGDRSRSIVAMPMQLRTARCRR